MDDNINIKVCFVGECCVGKTMMLERYVNGIYIEGNESSTRPNYGNKELKLKKNLSINLDLWDMGGGQEIYRGLNKNFIINSNIAILIYDICNKRSFEEIKNYHYETVKEVGEKNIVCGLAGNKCDLFNSEEVSEKEAIQYSKEIGAIFQYTSNKDNIGIDELILKCVYQYLANNNIIKKEDIPIKYIPYLELTNFEKFKKKIFKYFNY